MKIIRILFNILCVLAIIGIIYFSLNYKIFIVASGSMQPTLKMNELVLVENTKKDTKYQIGDIITYYDNEDNIYITHRIIDIQEEGYYTKGDFNNTRDNEIVTKEDLVGKMIYSSIYLGNLYVKYRFVLLALVIGFIIIIGILLGTRKQKGVLREDE